jgi:hypothetical protein
MKAMILILLISSLNMFISCCSVLSPDEKLSMQRIDYVGNELRIDGYYYSYAQNGNTTAIYFLYKNGIILSLGGYLTQDLDNIEKKIPNKDFKSKDHWGVFIVNKNTIQYEKWVGSTGFSACLYKCTGYIENDTTIHFTESYYSERNETKQIDEVWHFKQFDNKPDSTNVYIK